MEPKDNALHPLCPAFRSVEYARSPATARPPLANEGLGRQIHVWLAIAIGRRRITVFRESTKRAASCRVILAGRHQMELVAHPWRPSMASANNPPLLVRHLAMWVHQLQETGERLVDSLDRAVMPWPASDAS